MNLYVRLLWTLFRARFKPRIALGDTIELQLRVWPNDLDVNGHMNNGRYMTITDLAIIEYFSRSGFLRVMLEKGWRPMLGGSMISFRRGLDSFKAYTLRFSMLCWDERWSYMRFEFVHAGQTMAVGHAKGAIVGRKGIVSSDERFSALGVSQTSPAFPASLQAWIEAERLIRN
jgi:acyl-CoA thioesterase FadM